MNVRWLKGGTIAKLSFNENGRRVTVRFSWYPEERRIRGQMQFGSPPKSVYVGTVNVHSGLSSQGRLQYKRNRHVHRRRVIELLGGKCRKCGEDDIRVLQINHCDSNAKGDREEYAYWTSFYRAIENGQRDSSDLEVLCANCNIIYEYEIGHREFLA